MTREISSDTIIFKKSIFFALHTNKLGTDGATTDTVTKPSLILGHCSHLSLLFVNIVNDDNPFGVVVHIIHPMQWQSGADFGMGSERFRATT